MPPRAGSLNGTILSLAAAVLPLQAQVISSFDTITGLGPPTLDGTVTADGWVGALRSDNAGSALTGIFQGNLGVFGPQEGSGYMGMNFLNTTSGGTISTWAMSPLLTMQNGDTFSFYTRTVDTPNFPDRLEFRRSDAGVSVDVGANSASVGDFSNLLLTVNASLTTAGYPNTWTRFDGAISGLAGPTQGRLAFRYFVSDGGPSAANSDYIGIDNFRYTPVPEPIASVPVLAGVLCWVIRRRLAA